MKEGKSVPKRITKNMFLDMIERANKMSFRYTPVGLFWFKDRGKYVGVDNRHMDAWTEEFSSKNGCLQWLKEC